jgi:antitoxin VapB
MPPTADDLAAASLRPEQLILVWLLPTRKARTVIWTWSLDRTKGGCMAETDIARLFRNGRSQAVRLPRAFRFAGDRVRIRRFGRGVLLEPLLLDPDDWFTEMDRLGGDALLPEARRQPQAPTRAVELT